MPNVMVALPNKCQFVVVNVHQCSLLHEFATRITTFFLLIS